MVRSGRADVETWVKLGVGTFLHLLPDGNHAELGMSSQLTVTDEVNSFRR